MPDAQQTESGFVELQVKRLQVWLTFFGIIFGTTLVGLVTAFLNHQIQHTNVQLEQIKAEREYAKSYIDIAVTEDLPKRVRFAGYLKLILGEHWNAYYDSLIEEQKSKNEQVTKEAQEIDKLRKEAAQGSASLAESQRQIAGLNEKIQQLQGQHQTEQVNQARKELEVSNSAIEKTTKTLSTLAAEIQTKQNVVASLKDDLGLPNRMPGVSSTARVHIFFAGATEKEAADLLGEQLQAQGFQVPRVREIPRNAIVPDTIEIRFFRFPDERDAANSVLDVVKEAFPAAKARISYVANIHENPGHFEVWLSRDSAIKKP